MPQFCANLSWMYQEVPPLERFYLAKQDGFKAVEWLFPYDISIDAIKEQLEQHQLELSLINAPAGDWSKGERGLAIFPNERNRFRSLFENHALPTALTLGCKKIHIMAGLLASQAEYDVATRTFINSLEWALERIDGLSITLLIEPISLQSIPNYYLNYQAQALAIINQLNHPNLQLQLDLFHCQLMEGALTKHLLHALEQGVLGHIQIAGVPHRHEPSEGEINYSYLFDLLDQHHYKGFIGCEYSPRYGTSEGLTWLTPYLAANDFKMS